MKSTIFGIFIVLFSPIVALGILFGLIAASFYTGYRIAEDFFDWVV